MKNKNKITQGHFNQRKKSPLLIRTSIAYEIAPFVERTKRLIKLRINILWSLLFGFTMLATDFSNDTKTVSLVYPETWTKPVYDFEKNPLTKEGIALGRKLFYDPILSKDNSTSCSSCHLSFTTFTHVDHALSHGIGDSIGNRNSLALINLAWTKHFMWDGAANHLDVQSLAPINDPKELGETTRNVVEKLQQTEVYPPMFEAAFGDSTVTGEHLLKALSQFQLTFVSANSKYDQVMLAEEGVAFTEQETAGYQVFKANCAACHTEPLFTNGDFANNGLPVDTTLNDWGRILISQQAKDSLTFKVPTLRNIEFSKPYMHDGRFKKLSQVINHYTDGIHQSPTLAPELKEGIVISHKEKVDLLAFLLTLTDKEFMFNKDLSFPR